MPGLGCVIGSLVTGRLLDHDYKKVEKRYRKQKDIPRAPHPLSKQELIDFPIEKARQRNLWWIVAIFIGIVAAFGYSLQTDIDLPLLLQFLSETYFTICFAAFPRAHRNNQAPLSPLSSPSPQKTLR